MGLGAVYRFVGSVVHGTRDDGSIRVAVEEGDNDFVAYARNERRAPLVAGPGLHHAQVAGGIFIFLAFAVPDELDFDAAVFVDVDFFAGRSGDKGRLRAFHHRPFNQAWTIGNVSGDAIKTIFIE